MLPPARVVGLECLRCHAVFESATLFSGCPACRAQGASVNLSVKLDLSPLGDLTPEAIPTTPRGLWRFAALLPTGAARSVSLGEGATPLVHLRRLGERLGLP